MGRRTWGLLGFPEAALIGIESACFVESNWQSVWRTVGVERRQRAAFIWHEVTCICEACDALNNAGNRYENK